LVFAQNEGKVTGNVSLNIKEQTISAKLKYDYVNTRENESELKFYLNGDFVVSRVKCKICTAYEFDSKAKIPTLTVQLNKPIAKNERVRIEFDYSGKLGEMYHKEQEFLEMGLDFFWIPFDIRIGEFVFNYRLDIKTDTSDFVMVSNGKTTQKGKNWRIESKTADFDINVILGRNLNLKKYQEKGYDLRVVSKNLPDEVSDGLLNGMVESLDFFNTTFGKNRPQREVTAVFRPFELELGYFRKGYFILPSPKTADSLFFPISHELAHFWWSKANQQNDWLDESFAEYSAMLALRKLRGIEKFDAILERKKKLNVDLPPIYGFNRTINRRQTPMVLYVKGAMKLYDLEKQLGEEKFLKFLQKVEDERIITTDKLIEALREFASDDIADKFLANIKDS
jgi:hypothetical protein